MYFVLSVYRVQGPIVSTLREICSVLSTESPLTVVLGNLVYSKSGRGGSDFLGWRVTVMGKYSCKVIKKNITLESVV